MVIDGEGKIGMDTANLKTQLLELETSIMPIYEYECPRCKIIHEILQKITEGPLRECPDCKGPIFKKISRTSFQLKGSGWYVTDYPSKGKDPKDPLKEVNHPKDDPVGNPKGYQDPKAKNESGSADSQPAPVSKGSEVSGASGASGTSGNSAKTQTQSQPSASADCPKLPTADAKSGKKS